MDLQEKIERLLSEILSDRYESKITVTFMTNEEFEKEVPKYEPYNNRALC